MIRRVLVANRGEIASRVFTTCRRLGIETVAVHSDADADLPYVAQADAAVRLPGNTPAETYLRADLLVDAAQRSGADAVHPGYGFLAENAGFARAVIAAGLTWVGPRPESIEQMGSKVESKRLMADAGVPVLPSLTVDTATEADLPLLVKASAGGGGRGMRIVRTLGDLASEITAAQAEAASAFGDGTVFVEPYVEHGRHVEVQIWGDFSGTNVSVLGARDCSIQRRHQKVVEESPPPGLAAETLGAMYDAARAAGHAISYVGAGTVEFLLDADDPRRFWFLEMNTRLQVEHPVTEAVEGGDLVELQLAAAESPTTLGVGSVGGGSVGGGSVGGGGHAIEVRLYAEDPAASYQPTSGLLTSLDVPGVTAWFERTPGAGLRLDAAYAPGNEVSTHYDAMLAKVIAHGPDRASAARRLADALARARIHGLTTNRDLLVAVLRSPEFLSGKVSTGFLEQFRPPQTDIDEGAAVAAALALAERTAARRRVQRGMPVAWRNVPSQPQRTAFEEGVVEWWGGRARRDGRASSGYAVEGYTVVEASPARVVLEQDGVRTPYDVVVGAGHVDVDSPRGHRRLTPVPRFADPSEQHASGSLVSPMPGTVVAVAAAAGDAVAAGATVLVLEAMKMQHTVTAPQAGTVTEIDVTIGQQVAAGDVLAVVQPEEETQ